LEYLAVSGSLQYLYSTNTNDDTNKSDKTITSTAPFDRLSKTTKEAVKYMSIQCNNITSLSGLTDYKNLITLRANNNELEDLKGIENMKDTLKSLNCKSNQLGKNESSTGKDATKDALAPLQGFSAISNLDLNYNQIIWIDYINLSGITYSTLFLNNNSSFDIDSVSAISDKYLATDEVINYQDMSLTDTSQKITNLVNMSSENKLKVKSISLSGNSALSNTTINSVLSGMNNLIAVDLTGCTNLTSINWISGMTQLEQFFISDTSVTNISALENITTIKGSTIQNTINRCCANSGNTNKYYTTVNGIGLGLRTASLTSQLEGLTNLDYFNLDYATCPTSLNLSGFKSSCRFTINKNISYTLPSTVNYIYLNSSCSITNTTLTINKLALHTNGYTIGRLISCIFTTGKNITVNNATLAVCGGGNITTALTKLSSANNLNTLTITHCAHQGTGIYIDNFETLISSFTDLTTLSITWVEINTIRGLENLTGLTNLTIQETQIYDLTPLANLTNLTRLTLNDNSINKLVGLENLNRLTTIDLSNNSLDLTYTTKDENGNDVVKNNLDILARLNTANGGQLTSITMTGNTNITDYSTLQSLSWSTLNY
jgi:hypothetical protein